MSEAWVVKEVVNRRYAVALTDAQLLTVQAALREYRRRTSDRLATQRQLDSIDAALREALPLFKGEE